MVGVIRQSLWINLTGSRIELFWLWFLDRSRIPGWIENCCYCIFFLFYLVSFSLMCFSRRQAGAQRQGIAHRRPKQNAITYFFKLFKLLNRLMIYDIMLQHVSFSWFSSMILFSRVGLSISPSHNLQRIICSSFWNGYVKLTGCNFLCNKCSRL